ncbi:MAG: hypothetical protein VKK98_02540 [Cyanobacteriota bacterium]|nr:hypothetical protein [Cyanobacteriota bacterium]
MEEQSDVPESVSYRQLRDWLGAAADSSRQETLSSQLESWSHSSRQLLALLQAAGPELGEGRSPRQLMALGALQAHLAMALQAGAASGC